MGIFSSKSSKSENKLAAENSIEAVKTNREIIAEKYQKMKERSLAIQQEMERVKEFNKEIENRYLKK